MMSTSRYGSMLLSRTAARQPFASPMAIRSFTTSPHSLDDSAPPPWRVNPLVAKNRPPPKPQADRTPPVSTERPRATTPPHPSRAPVSSAEVPPNADLPPPPPRHNAPLGEATAAAAEQEGQPTDPAKGAYDVNAPLDLNSLLNNAYNQYSVQTGLSKRAASQQVVYARPVTGKTVILEGRFGGAKVGNPIAGFKVLDRLVKDQQVKRIFNRQRFHERPGKRRKRLKSQRWRARFKVGFKAAASRVLELKKQGW